MRIIYPHFDEISVLIPADCGMSIAEIASKDVPDGIPFLLVDESDIPSDREFRAAWTADFSVPDGYGGMISNHYQQNRGKLMKILIDLDKAKIIAHNKRRLMREKDFEPFDEAISKQIPGKSTTELESARVGIRQKYSEMQEKIDTAESVEEIKAALAK